ncbi:MAG: sensor histidine kinase, partial [Epsilonproteobacteria bacterium]|nr:sensor histidine kinase [Campylobacterota bacterium]
MFHNLRLNIFIYYFLTVVAFLSLTYYFLVFIQIQSIMVFAFIMLMFTAVSAFMISKLAIDPLEEYMLNLQNLSKETLHELNLPISTIVTNISMLKKKTQDEKDLKRLQRVQSACDMLQKRYDELDYMIKKQTAQELKERFD